jgi:Fe-S-cluster containining protein
MARGLTIEERTALLAQVRDVYARLAQRPVERNCVGRTDCCRFRLTGQTPFLTRGEALVARQAARAAGKKKLPLPADGSCPMLGPDGRCTIYESRPFACRTHFCEAAGGPYSRREVRDLIHELEAIDQRFGGSGGMGLPAAMKWAVEQAP